MIRFVFVMIDWTAVQEDMLQASWTWHDVVYHIVIGTRAWSVAVAVGGSNLSGDCGSKDKDRLLRFSHLVLVRW